MTAPHPAHAQQHSCGVALRLSWALSERRCSGEGVDENSVPPAFALLQNVSFINITEAYQPPYYWKRIYFQPRHRFLPFP